MGISSFSSGVRCGLMAATLAQVAACEGAAREPNLGPFGNPGTGTPASGGMVFSAGTTDTTMAGATTGGTTGTALADGPEADAGITVGTPADAMPTPPPPMDEASAGCGAPSFPEAGPKTIDVGSTERQFVVELPQNYDPNRPYRLVFAWHGLGGTAAMTARGFFGLATLAEDSAIFIAGQGLPGGGQSFANWNNPGDRDIAFTRAVLQWAKSSYCVDVERVFSIGMSNGGMMSNVVGCELGDEFRAIAALSGGGPRGYARTQCVGQIAALVSHGNRDNNVPFSYGQASRDYWIGANHCGAATTPGVPADTCSEYQGCDDGFPVQFCEFDGGHTIPAFTAGAVWNFFARL